MLPVVLKHFGGNSRRTSLFSPKGDYLRKEHWNTQIFFLKIFEKYKPEENLDLFKQLFLVKPEKWENLTKPCCFPQSEPHTAKLCFSVVLKHFFGKFTEKFSFYSKKWLSRKGALKYLEFFFLNMFEKGQI